MAGHEEPARGHASVVANECRSRRRGPWFRTLRIAEPRISTQADVADAAAGAADLERAVAALDKSARLLLFLHFYMDLSHEEAGRVLGISGAAAKTRLYRTLRALPDAGKPWQASSRSSWRLPLS